MTKKISCRDAERLILEREDRALAPGERGLVEDHLGGCGRCRGFAADRTAIRGEAAAVAWPRLSEDLDRKTRRMFRENAPATPPAAVPTWVLIAVAAVAIATGLWLAVSLANVTPDMTLAELPISALAAVFIVVQNALMLLFAPVVLRTFRTRRGAPRSA